MQLKHIKNLLPPQDGAAKICCVAWAPNNTKFAVCTHDRVILLFDEHGERKDKFSTKPADPKYGKKSYMVKGIAFSPDSTKIAVGQTDDIVYVYKIGDDWSDKKVICNKFGVKKAVTCLIWLLDQQIIFGTADGKIRTANIRTNKSSVLYDSNSYVVSLAASPNGKGILSGHADGGIVRYFFSDDQSGDKQGKICTHPSAPYALAWASNSFMAAGCDKRVFAYGKDGRIMQQFDYSREDDEKEFTNAVASPSGMSVVIGSFDRLRVFNWSPRKGLWDEGKAKEIKNLYTITALAWKQDGSKLILGSLCGSVEIFDCSLKKLIYKNRYEILHIGINQVMVTDKTKNSSITLTSNYGYEIGEVKLMGGDRYILAHTSDTLLLADVVKKTKCEIPWHVSGGKEKYFFDNENVCIISNAGELTLVEYGKNEVLGSVRTEFINPHLISVTINERKKNSSGSTKILAYLIDMKTIAIFDLISGMVISNISHENKIGWLELNETGQKLLFRDSKLKLHLYDVESQTRTTILNYCSYVQWVPGSDVLVAQNRSNLCIWYNIDAPERATTVPIKGDIMSVERLEGRTDVLVNEGVATVAYTLDEGLIEFVTATDDGDFARAVAFLENLEMSPETEAMWKTLSKLSLEAKQLLIAERCFAALGDVARTKFLNETNLIVTEANNNQEDGLNHPKVQANLAILDKNFKLAENIYLEQNQTSEAIKMYQEIHKWDEAIIVAEAKNHPELENLKRKYYQMLMDTHQEDRAGELKENEGDHLAAIQLYLKAGMPAKAARLAATKDSLINNADLIQTITNALVKAEMYERAGDLYEKIKRHQEAVQFFKKGHVYRRAVELARTSFPQQVVLLEEEWGDYLVQQKQLDAASNHFIEAGATLKAIDASVNARQWDKAIQILSVVTKKEETNKYYLIIARHYASISEYQLAEKYYLEAENTTEAIDMYNAASKWEEAYRLASKYMDKDKTKDLYSKRAKELEEKARYKDAERLYITVGCIDDAIGMYKRLKLYNDMIRLVKQHRPNHLIDTHLHLAKILEAENNLRQAEHHYIEGRDVNAAINIYYRSNKWEEAYRVAKAHGGPWQQVAYHWAQSMGGDSAIKLLNKFGLLETAITMAMAMDPPDFEFAFDLARIAMKNKLPDISERYAEYLEEKGRFAEAEAEFIRAGKPKSAVLMYVSCRDWDAAQRVAEQYDKNSVSDVLIGQGHVAFESKDFQKAESFLLRAQRPELALKWYKDAGMWQDALRVCKEYLPNQLPSLQEEYDNQMNSESTKDLEALVEQAKGFEQKAEYSLAVDCYLRVNKTVTTDTTILERCYKKAAQLAFKFLSDDKSASVVQTVAPRLVEMQKFTLAAEMFVQANMIKEAVMVLIAGEEWAKARKVATEFEPKLLTMVDEKYKMHLKDKDKLDDLEGVDAEAALERYIAKNEWQKAINIAEKKVPKLLPKYVAQYSSNLIRENKTTSALALFTQYGAPAIVQNFNIYKRIFMDMMNLPMHDSEINYKTYASLRDMLLDLCNNISESSLSGRVEHEDFQKMLLISHYYANQMAMTQVDSLDDLAAKLSISLLRHIDAVPVDKAFYEAGMHCRKAGWDNLAFIFLNRYLDLVEAIEDHSVDGLDQSSFKGSDIPTDFPLPEQTYVQGNEHEGVKEWVLAISMNQKSTPELELDERGVFEGSLVSKGQKSKACSVTGYPVLSNRIEFKKNGCLANKDDWNKFLMAIKTTQKAELQDVFKFIGEWCGAPSAGYTFH